MTRATTPLVSSLLPDKYQNRFPDDTGLWTNPRVLSHLHTLLGAQYRTFFGCIELKAPARVVNGVLYVTGSNVRDRTYAGVFALKLSTGELYVRLRQRGHDSEFPKSGPPFALPEGLRLFTGHWAQWPESRALAQGRPVVTDESVARDEPPFPNDARALPLHPHS